MSSHAMAAPNMRGVYAITGAAFGNAGVLRCAIGRFARRLGRIRQAPSPAALESQPIISPFCVGQNPARVTISQKDLYHAR
jgi:hypothetical protein